MVTHPCPEKHEITDEMETLAIENAKLVMATEDVLGQLQKQIATLEGLVHEYRQVEAEVNDD